MATTPPEPHRLRPVQTSKLLVTFPSEVRQNVYAQILKTANLHVDVATGAILRSNGWHLDLPTTVLKPSALAQTCSLMRDEFTSFCKIKDAAKVTSLILHTTNFNLDPGTKPLSEPNQNLDEPSPYKLHCIVLQTSMTSDVDEEELAPLYCLITSTCRSVQSGIPLDAFEVHFSRLSLSASRVLRLLKEVVRRMGLSQTREKEYLEALSRVDNAFQGRVEWLPQRTVFYDDRSG